MLIRVKNFAKSKYKIFAKWKLYQNLKKIKILRKVKIVTGKIIWKAMPANLPLHGDPIAIKMFKRLVENGKIDFIVETGTFRGFTTSLFAKMFPNIKIYTCEINEFNYKKAKRGLSKFKNVHIFRDTSPKFLNRLFEEKMINGRILFYLDAHWLDDWPLEEELKIVSKNAKSAIIVIDDFKVPKDQRFKFDKYGDKECSLEMVVPNIEKANKYFALFPNYGEEVFDKNSSHHDLTGYLILFQNMTKDLKAILDGGFVKKFFKEFSNLIRPIS